MDEHSQQLFNTIIQNVDLTQYGPQFQKDYKAMDDKVLSMIPLYRKSVQLCLEQQNQIKDLQTEINESKAHYRTLAGHAADEKEQANAQIHEANAQIHEANAQIEKLLTEITKLKSNYQRLQNTHNTLQNTHNTLQNTHNTLQNTHNTMCNEYSKAHKKRADH